MTTKGDFASLFENPTAGREKGRRPRLEPGQEVEGVVLELSGGLVILDIGLGADATLDQMELGDREVKIGDRLRALVKNARSDAPELTLALGRGGGSISTANIELARSSGTPVAGTVTAAVKGGFSVDVGGIRAFCPISQIDLSYVNEPEVWVGQSLEFKVTEVREGGRNVIVSRKALLEAQRKAAQADMLDKLTVGSVVSGTVRQIGKHGIVVDLGGIDGFVHISELAHGRVQMAEDVVSLGERVEAKVLSNEANERGPTIRLSMKALASPAAAPEAPPNDTVLDAKVVGHVVSGILVSTKHGDGLVPARELDLPPGADHKRAFPAGTELRVTLVHRDPATGKMRFSVKQVAHVEEQKNYREFAGNQGSRSSGMGSLGDLLAERFGGGLKAGDGKADAKNPPKRGR